MNIDDEKAFKLLRDDRDTLEEENRALKEDNALLKRQAEHYAELWFDADAANDRMKNISWWAVVASFIISYVLGFAIIHSMCPTADLGVKMFTSVGVWFGTWVTYYFVWLFDNSKRHL